MADGAVTILTANGVAISGIHSSSECAGRHCWVHNPSAHPLRNAPVYAIGDGIYRTCDHRPGDAPGYSLAGLHADPDHLDFLQGPTKYRGWQARFEHGGCCDARCCEVVGGE